MIENVMQKIKVWIKAVRAPFFTATIIPVTFGSIVAWYDTDTFMWPRFWLTLLGALLFHMGTNLANDYFDHLWGNDEANTTPTPFSGGSRMIQNGLILPRWILGVSLASFALGGAIGLYLNSISRGNVVLWIGIIGIFLGFFYTARPFRIGYSGVGELAVGIGFGPLMILGSYYVQAQSLPFKVYLISIPIGLLILLVVFINEFPDYLADKAVGKRTMVVLFGKRHAVIVYHVLLTTVYLIIVLLVLLNLLPRICLISFLTLPLALKAFTVSKRNYDKIYELLPANASTIGLHSMIGILLSAGLVLDKLV